MLRIEVLLIILGCAVVTFLSRIVPIWAMSKLSKIGPKLRCWLYVVPVAAIMVLLAKSLLMPVEISNIQFVFLRSLDPHLIATGLVFLVALLSERLLVSLLVGIAGYFVSGLFF